MPTLANIANFLELSEDEQFEILTGVRERRTRPLETPKKKKQTTLSLSKLSTSDIESMLEELEHGGGNDE